MDLLSRAPLSVVIALCMLPTVLRAAEDRNGKEETRPPEVQKLLDEGEAAQKKGRYAEALAACQEALALTDKEGDPK
jgi:hypothetical protein